MPNRRNIEEMPGFTSMEEMTEENTERIRTGKKLISKFEKKHPISKKYTALERKYLFMEWYTVEFQNNKPMAEVIRELANLLFMSEKTIRNIIYRK